MEKDYYRLIASKYFKIEYDKVTKELRNYAKILILMGVIND